MIPFSYEVFATALWMMLLESPSWNWNIRQPCEGAAPAEGFTKRNLLVHAAEPFTSDKLVETILAGGALQGMPTRQF